MTAVQLLGAGLTYPGPPPVTALHPCDFVARRGEYVAIIGPSGSGKSTMLNLLGLLDRPTAGTYILNGVDTGAARERVRVGLRANEIGFVFQSFHLLPHRTALENVMLAHLYRGTSTSRRRQLSAEALGRVGLGQRLESTPQTLSGGEQQRVAIARALAGTPSLLLCDEPTGNLDSATARTVLDLIDESRRGDMTVIMITHDPQVAARAERVARIQDGVLTE